MTVCIIRSSKVLLNLSGGSIAAQDALSDFAPDQPDNLPERELRAALSQNPQGRPKIRRLTQRFD